MINLKKKERLWRITCKRRERRKDEIRWKTEEGRKKSNRIKKNESNIRMEP